MPLSRRTHWLRRHFDFRPRKAWGQNFLVDEAAARRLTAAAAELSPRRVIEIGAGLGALTVPLAAGDWELAVFETDRKLCEILRWLLSDIGEVGIREDDFLAVDLAELVDQRTVAVGNLPYYITSPILQKLLERQSTFSGLILTVQQEVAARLQAQPATKQYGPLTIFCQYYVAATRTIQDLPPEAFWPSPQVHSRTLLLTPRDEPPAEVLAETTFFEAMRGAFAHRRKTLRNSLRTATNLNLTDEQADAILAEAQLDGGRRAETLDFDEFVSLGNALYQLTQGT